MLAIGCVLLLLSSKDSFVFAQQQHQRRRAIVNGRVVVDPSNALFFARSGQDQDESTIDYLCGATLIHDDMLLTAAHCQGAFNYGLFLYDPLTNDFTREATVDLQIRYPDFNGKDKHNDLLLLRLSVDPMLPHLVMNRDDSIPTHNNNVMKAYGFGKTASDGTLSDVLREGFFRYIPNEECTERVRSTRTSIWDDVLCADPASVVDNAERNTNGAGNDHDHGNGGSSICQGDSGGPLIDAKNNLLLGVVSWNFLCHPDELPDGFIRVSHFHDWITEQICFYSRNPLSSNNECPSGTSPPSPPQDSVEILLTFEHDFNPEEMFFRILSKDRINQVDYAGPRYVPARISAWTSRLHLLPGDYILEIFDITGNGLSGSDRGSDQTASWKLTALYGENFEKELASSSANFFSIDLVDFVVENNSSQILIPEEIDDQQLNECLSKKLAEDRSFAPSSGIICECVKTISSLSTTSSGRSGLSCFDTNTNTICASNRGACGDNLSLKCCGNRRCSNGICRLASQGRDDKKIPLMVKEGRRGPPD